MGGGERADSFGARPLSGKRVLITRPAQQAGELAARLREAGAEPVVAPTIEIAAPADLDAARAAVARARAYDWIVFTSRNAVEAFFERLAELRDSGLSDDASALGGAHVAAIGPKTAEALASRAIRVDLIPTEFVNEAVAEALLARTSPAERVLLYRAQDARDVLPDSLREHGRVVDVVTAYQTRFVDDPALTGKAERCDIVTFTSSSAVTGFLRNVPDAAHALSSKTVAAIGPITAQTARDAGIRVDVVAEEFTTEGLVRALATSR